MWPLEWAGATTFTGSVGAAGDTLTVELTYTFTHDFPDGKRFEMVDHVVVTGLPFTRAYLSMGRQHVEYAVSGIDARDYVTLIENHSTNWDAGGTVTSHGEYFSTDWERPDAQIELFLNFGE